MPSQNINPLTDGLEFALKELGGQVEAYKREKQNGKIADAIFKNNPDLHAEMGIGPEQFAVMSAKDKAAFAAGAITRYQLKQEALQAKDLAEQTKGRPVNLGYTRALTKAAEQGTDLRAEDLAARKRFRELINSNAIAAQAGHSPELTSRDIARFAFESGVAQNDPDSAYRFANMLREPPEPFDMSKLPPGMEIATVNRTPEGTTGFTFRRTDPEDEALKRSQRENTEAKTAELKARKGLVPVTRISQIDDSKVIMWVTPERAEQLLGGNQPSTPAAPPAPTIQKRVWDANKRSFVPAP
jgi:hypothetical protein